MLQSHKYGARIRKLVVAALRAKKALYECPTCGKMKVTNRSFARWECRSCESKFTGGAYIFTTETGAIANRMVKEYQKL